MSEIHFSSKQSIPIEGAENRLQTESPAAIQPSFPERFLDSFFQEKNIKWLLVVGACIVFGSSLMLVTKAWPNWSNAMRFLTILGYTGLIYGAAEVSRLRLGLTATYKVLYSLTLLLLPVSFLALQWLTANSGTQSLEIIKLLGLLIPAIAFLWFASCRILDHVLKGRQTTFLISFCLLGIAGALPRFDSALVAFAFTAITWAVFSAGVLKVNRHMFWLAEEHRMPRVFGFLPIAMLGLQFIVLVATKAVHAVPTQWMGLVCVLAAATVFVTARTVADVFRQRTGNLVRPLPWHIVIPIFSGLVLTALGMALSFKGFSYVGTTTYAVIPTSIIASLLMWMAARDSRHTGFVWAGIICATVAYQCSPTLCSDVVHALKNGTAQAIGRERVPFSFYGITYIPLLSIFAIASRWFANRKELTFSAPLKHFVTLVSGVLLVAATTDRVSQFVVSSAFVAVSMLFAMLFADRRYTLAALFSLVVATGLSIPELNSMGYINIASEWSPALLATLAVVLTATRLPDKILNTIPIHANSVIQHRNLETNCLTGRSFLLQNADGRHRNLCQLTGCLLAALLAAHWVGFSLMHFSQQLSNASITQFVLLMVAFVLYTLRNPRYLSGLTFWTMLGFASVRAAAGLDYSISDFLNVVSMVTAASSLICYLWLKASGQITETVALGDLRKALGFNSNDVLNGGNLSNETTGGWRRLTQAFVVPLCDLSLVILSCLAAAFHLPLLLIVHASALGAANAAAVSVGLATTLTVVWLAAATVVFRSRTASIAAAAILPLWASGAAISLGVLLTAPWCLVVWAMVESCILISCSLITKSNRGLEGTLHISKVSEIWVTALLMGSCLSFSPVLRLVAAICLLSFAFVDRSFSEKPRLTFFAIMANIQLLLLAATFGGCSGPVMSVLSQSSFAAIPFVFLTAAISAAVLDRIGDRLDLIITQTWTALLRAGMLVLAVLSLSGPALPMASTVMLLTGFLVAAVTELLQAVRRQQEGSVWSACAVVGVAVLFLFDQGVLSFGAGKSQFILLAISIAALSLAYTAKGGSKLNIVCRPMLFIGQGLPIVVTTMAIVRNLSVSGDIETAKNALAMMIAGGIYFHQAMVTRKRGFAITAAAMMNVGLMLLWNSQNFSALEFYLVPVGLSVLGFVELMRKELPQASHDPLRYIGALIILVSPVSQVLDGSWAHMLTLLVLSVVVILAAIGLRIRVLVYAGTAFLLADLIAMTVHTTMGNPLLLWIGGILLGIAVIALAAFCENHREKLLARVRMMSAELATWN